MYKNESIFSKTVWTIWWRYQDNKLDIDKLVPAPVDLSKLSDVVKNDVVKKTVYHKLVAKVNSIDTSAFIL